MSIYFQPSFSSSAWTKRGVQMCKLSSISHERLKIEVKLLFLSATRKLCMLRQQRMTLSDLEWPFHASRAISAMAELLVLYILNNFNRLCCRKVTHYTR